MKNKDSSVNEGSGVKLWSKRLRVFHWVNAAVVIMLIGLGLIISNSVPLIKFTESFTESLVPYHIALGVIFSLNLIYRFSYMFNTSDKGESFKEINILSKDNINQLKEMPKQKKGFVYDYHNPVGRFMVFLWFLILPFQVITGGIMAYNHLTEDDNIEVSDTTHNKKLDLKADFFNSSASSDHHSVENDGKSHHGDAHEEEDEIVSDIHEYSMFLIILMLFAHIGGVIKESIRIKKNLVKKMINGS